MNQHLEAKAVRAVIQDYIDGTYHADIAKLTGVFHKNAVMNGYLGPQLLLATPDAFLADIQSQPSMASKGDPYHAEIEFLSIEGGIANVILTESGFRGAACLEDHFHLVKEDGAWKIISKLFTTVG